MNANRVIEFITEQYTKMFESRISAGAVETLPGWGKKPHAETVAWSCDMEGHAQKCVERYCELANKKDKSSCTKSQLFAWMARISRRRNLNQLEKCLKYARRLSQKCLHLARIGRHEILWSVNTLARSVTTWTRACDRRLACLISYIHRTNDCRQYFSCGKHGPALSTGFIPRLGLCW